MPFAAPIWLALLVPWGVITLWLLWGRRRRTDVPFLDLWLAEVESPRAKRSMRLPPLALLAAIVAVLLAIVAAARPVLRDPSRGPLVAIIVDRGLSMSATGRLAEVIERAKDEMLAFGHGPTELVSVPDGGVRRSDRSGWIGLASKLEGTAISTRDALARAIREALARNEAPIFVLTDQSVPPDPRIVRIAPTRPLENVAIIHLAVRELPRAQAMVTVRNDSAAGRAELRVETNGRQARRQIDLPARGRQRDFFVDLPSLGRSVRAEIDVADDLPADNRRWLAKEQAWPRVEMRSAVPGQVRRVVEAYRKARAWGEGSEVVAVASTLRPQECGVVVATPPDTFWRSASKDQSLEVRDHPVTTNIAWSQIDLELFAAISPGSAALRPGRSAAEPGDRTPPGQAWTPILSFNGIPLIAIRETPARQVWVSLNSADFAKTTDFVILWTNILDWLAGGEEKSLWREAAALGAEWRPVEAHQADLPGLYERGDGALRAVNAPSQPPHPPPHEPVDRKHLTALSATARRGTELLPWLIFASLACVALAAMGWPRSRLTPHAPTRTV